MPSDSSLAQPIERSNFHPNSHPLPKLKRFEPMNRMRSTTWQCHWRQLNQNITLQSPRDDMGGTAKHLAGRGVAANHLGRGPRRQRYP